MNLTAVAVRECKSELLWDFIWLHSECPSARSEMIKCTGVDVLKSKFYSQLI